MEATPVSVTDRAPSSTLRATYLRASSWTLGIQNMKLALLIFCLSFTYSYGMQSHEPTRHSPPVGEYLLVIQRDSDTQVSFTPAVFAARIVEIDGGKKRIEIKRDSDDASEATEFIEFTDSFLFTLFRPVTFRHSDTLSESAIVETFSASIGALGDDGRREYTGIYTLLHPARRMWGDERRIAPGSLTTGKFTLFQWPQSRAKWDNEEGK
jgi:hypothetical protein